MAEGSMPWQTSSAKGEAKQSEHFKYQYHPGGDQTKAPKDAPSALHSVIVPNVTLTKVCVHCRPRSYVILTGGSERNNMICSTNGEKMTGNAPSARKNSDQQSVPGKHEQRVHKILLSFLIGCSVYYFPKSSRSSDYLRHPYAIEV